MINLTRGGKTGGIPLLWRECWFQASAQLGMAGSFHARRTQPWGGRWAAPRAAPASWNAPGSTQVRPSFLNQRLAHVTQVRLSGLGGLPELVARVLLGHLLGASSGWNG